MPQAGVVELAIDSCIRRTGPNGMPIHCTVKLYAKIFYLKGFHILTYTYRATIQKLTEQIREENLFCVRKLAVCQMYVAIPSAGPFCMLKRYSHFLVITHQLKLYIIWKRNYELDFIPIIYNRFLAETKLSSHEKVYPNLFICIK